MDEVHFLSLEKHFFKDFFKLMLSFQVCITRHSQIPKLTSLLFLFNILRMKWVIKFIFCMQRNMKVSFKSILSFWSGWSSIPKFPKIASLKSSPNGISNKKLQTNLIFFFNQSWCQFFGHQRVHQVLKVKGLQYFYNISKS